MDNKELFKQMIADGVLTQEIAAKYCPELIVSEDERIRKEIIYHIKNCDDTIDEDTEKRMIAWLEKQGENGVVLRDTFGYEEGRQRGRDEGIRLVLDNPRKYRLEKQGGQKPANEYEPMSLDEAIKHCKEKSCGNNACALEHKQLEKWLTELKELKEQKPADKVEPKFHKGEWLCENKPNNYARFIQILEIVNVQGKDRYRISRDIHNDEDIVEFDFVEKYYHKFDIKDAKDGDLLVCIGKDGQEIGIIKEYVGKYGGCDKCFETYCFVDWDGIFRTGEYMGSKKNHPATKEQRDTLFAEMKEAGYEWDAEKKELKKIEQNAIEPDDLIEESYQQQANDLIDMVTEKPAWSEEDKVMLDEIIDFFENGTVKLQHDLSLYASWLKSIKHQNTWKPSDEQMWALSTLANIPESASDTCKKTAQELLEQLKKLK